MRILSSQQMQEADRLAIEEIGIPSIVLMENAGRQVVRVMEERFGDLGEGSVGVLCGSGNNGGDGFVVARTLWQQGIYVTVFLFGSAKTVVGESSVNLDILKKIGVPVLEVCISDAEVEGEDRLLWRSIREEVLATDVLVDAILGNGMVRPLEGVLQQVVTDINGADSLILSVDLPTGLQHVPPDGGVSASNTGVAMKAEVTVTLAAPKTSFFVGNNQEYIGEVVVADIGIPRFVINNLPGDRVELVTAEAVCNMIPEPPINSHKGNFGHVLVVAGSVRMMGAAILACLGALRSGAGLVTLAAPDICAKTVASVSPELMTLPLPSEDDGTISMQGLERVIDFSCDIVAIGPGLGSSPSVNGFVSELIDQLEKPLVIDADGLNVIARKRKSISREGRMTIITPHPGEMSRLCGLTTADVQRDRIGVASRFAVDNQIIVVLKGANTVIAAPSGSAWINPTGSPAMSSGGVGDVLTGVVSSWTAQLESAIDSCQIAVYLHGLAGDLAAKELKERGVTATDVVNHLPKAEINATSSNLFDKAEQ